MEPDFSGYASKAGVKCSDGRTIMPNAFQHQDAMRVPLVWQHSHGDPTNVLGHAILENREDGVYAYCFFNNTDKAKHAKTLVEHGDIDSLSIWANELVQRAGRVLHGAIREVSLVLSGANAEARIESVTLRHSNGDEEVLESEGIIYSGEQLSHSEFEDDEDDDSDDEYSETDEDEDSVVSEDDDEEDEELEDNSLDHANMSSDMTVKEVYDSMTEEQKQVLHFMIGEALAENNMAHAAVSADATVKDIYESMTEEQKQVLHYMIGEALSSAAAAHDNLADENSLEGSGMTRNAFENRGSEAPTLSHDNVRTIVADAVKNGSLKDAVERFAGDHLAHGIDDIDLLFPEAKTLDASPEFLSRRMEWVTLLLAEVRKSPFSRIKTIAADITFEEARAKGYVKGNMKKEEFFGVSRRVTSPTTIYKKQKLDRDDILDITDFDVVMWLKAEMRVMLDEELARAILLGDGRDIAHDDKINEQNIRPIANDNELFTTEINVNIDDSNSSMQEVIDAIVLNRRHYRGSGMPTLFTNETYIGRFLLMKDDIGRRLYRSLDELATELRVKAVVGVEAMEEYPELVGVIVNPADYTIGADKGGQVSMFDDFDIDYNQNKYLLETRVSGALTKVKSAMVIRKVAGTKVLATPVAPTFDEDAMEITITDTTGVVYKNGEGTTLTNAGGPYDVVAGTAYVVNATPATGYYFGSSEDDSWTYFVRA